MYVLRKINRDQEKKKINIGNEVIQFPWEYPIYFPPNEKKRKSSHRYHRERGDLQRPARIKVPLPIRPDQDQSNPSNSVKSRTSTLCTLHILNSHGFLELVPKPASSSDLRALHEKSMDRVPL
jgi:hypothetical protein